MSLAARTPERPADLPALPRAVLFVFWSALLHLVLLFVLDDFLRGSIPGRATVLQLRLTSEPALKAAAPAPVRLNPSAKRDRVPGKTTPEKPAPASMAPSETIQMVPAGTDVYREADELDVQPVPLGPVMPVYPEAVLADGTSGYADLQLLIDETGRVHRIEVIDGSPPGVFDEAALAAFRDVPFSPGQKGSMPAKSRIVMRVSFDASAPVGGELPGYASP